MHKTGFLITWLKFKSILHSVMSQNGANNVDPDKTAPGGAFSSLHVYHNFLKYLDSIKKFAVIFLKVDLRVSVTK